MPHEWNKVIVVTKDELVPDYFPTEKALIQKLWRDSKKPYGIRRVRMGKGLGNEVLIQFDSLPSYIRKELGDPRKVDCSLERFFWEDKEAVLFYANCKAGKTGYIDPDRQREYVLDASVIMATMRLKAARIEEMTSKGMSIKNLDKSISESVNIYNEFRALKKLPLHTLPTNHIRLKEKIRRFEAEGYQSLLRGYDNENATKKTDKMTSLLNAMYIKKEKPTLAEVVRLYEGFLSGYVQVINPNTGEIYNPKEYGKLSHRTITAFLSSWKEKVATHLQRSADRQKYMTKFDPHQTLEHPEFAGSIISIDDRQPPFEYEKGKRLWFYNAMDLGSECYIAFVWGKTKEGLILDFYKELVRNYAEFGVCMPAELECESSLNSQFKETFLREGSMFRFVRILANAARAKRMEGYYRQIRYTLEKERAEWLGRPFARDEANQTNSEKKEIIPYDTLVRKCLEDIQTWNNMPHSKHPDKTRWEVFLEKQHPELTPINWRSILPYIGEKTETSCNAGQIILNRSYFLLGDNGELYTGERLLNLMEVVEGREIDVYWLRGHDGRVLKAMVYLNGRCVCEAIPKPIAKRSQLEAIGDPQAAHNFELMERYKSTIRGYAQRHKNEIEKLIIVDNRVRTLNNKFQVAQLLPTENMYREDVPDEVEVLEEVDSFNCDLNNIETGYNSRSFKDRY